jgi:recombinational DNA repair protein (RecF pathway)
MVLNQERSKSLMVLSQHNVSERSKTLTVLNQERNKSLMVLNQERSKSLTALNQDNASALAPLLI